jgi:hypothetical protein
VVHILEKSSCKAVKRGKGRGNSIERGMRIRSFEITESFKKVKKDRKIPPMK